MSDRIVKIPSRFAHLGDALEKLVAEAEEKAQAAEAGKDVDVAALERTIAAATATAEREALRGVLQALDIDAQFVAIQGKRFAKVGRYEGSYQTQAGAVTVMRSLYREVEKRNAKTVDAVSLRAGVVVDGWLPETAKAMAFLIQNGTSREAEAISRQIARLPYSRCSFERIGHAVANHYEARRATVDKILIEEFTIPPEAASVSLSIDRVAMPMEEPRPRPVGRPKEGAPKRPVLRAWRMAYCATITLHDAKGEALHTIRYGRTPQRDSRDLIGRMAEDLGTLLKRRPELRVVLLSDGAQEMLDMLDAVVMRAEVEADKVHRLVDYWHLVEKLAAAVAVICAADAAPGVLARWKSLLLNSENALGRIQTELYESGKEQVRVGDAKPVHEALTYLNNKRDRMNYAAARALGLPIGSGNVEATCKSLVGLRMKRPGARWKENTAQHVLHLRALALSDRWEPAIALTLAPLRMKVRRAA